MLQAIKRFWTAGTEGQPPSLARQITLVNQISMLAAVATLPYQLFYLVYDARYFLPVILTNFGFIGLYGSCAWLNRAGHFDLARNAVLGFVYAHLFAVTYLLGTGSGVQYFYFTLGACLGLIFARRRDLRILALLMLASVLFAICYLAFPPGTRPLEIPARIDRVMYLWSAIGAVYLAGGFSMLFRVEIDRAELELMRSKEELEKLSRLDALTGLANRRTLDEFLIREIGRSRRHSQPISVVLSDVDCFKAYNDNYGHTAGDACLKGVADVFAEAARRSGDLAARYGGEEFAVVLTATDADGALAVADEIRRRVEQLNLPHENSGAASIVTVSLGVVSLVPGDDDRPDDLIRLADEALYRAKNGGRNRVVLAHDPAAALPAPEPFSA